MPPYVSLAMSVYVPSKSIDKFANDATPLTAVTVVVPERTPSPPERVSVISPEYPETTPLDESRTDTSTGDRVVFTGPPDGCTVNANDDTILNTEDVAAFINDAVARSLYPPPTLSIFRLENVATPETAATLVVPDRVPLLGLAANEIDTVPENDVLILPNES